MHSCMRSRVLTNSRSRPSHSCVRLALETTNLEPKTPPAPALERRPARSHSGASRPPQTTRAAAPAPPAASKPIQLQYYQRNIATRLTWKSTRTAVGTRRRKRPPETNIALQHQLRETRLSTTTSPVETTASQKTRSRPSLSCVRLALETTNLEPTDPWRAASLPRLQLHLRLDLH